MNIRRTTWITFLILSALSLAVWSKFTYPQLAVSHFAVDRNNAVAIARDYLKAQGYQTYKDFRHAAVFRMDKGANRYLQRTLGFHGLQEFLKKHDFNLFFWVVRFFKENVKEEYLLEIDSADGEVTSFAHTIDESEAKRDITQEEARQKAVAFLKGQFPLFDPEACILQGDLSIQRDNRSDHIFSWQKKSVAIPWSPLSDSGTGKLLIKAKVSGDEVLAFNKNVFWVPDQFNRDIGQRKDISHSILLIIRIVMIALLTYGIFLIIVRQNHLAMQTTKKFYLLLMAISFALSLFGALNQFDQVLFSYGTTMSFAAYLGRTAANVVIGALFITVAMLVPGLAGELLHFETSSQEKRGSFLHYIRSSFASRDLAGSVIIGYFVCTLLLGLQSVLLKIGQTYGDVWIEYNWIDNVSTAYLPFLAALAIGYKASISEEIMYRLYTVNLGKKIFGYPSRAGKGNIVMIVLIASLIWGFAHSGSYVFPVWFRGIEVTGLGVFLTFIYLRFGLIPVIVGHFLFDVFWNSSGYLFGDATPFYFYSSVLVLLLPLALGAVAFVMNRMEEERPLRWHLNRHQAYNLEVLTAYLKAHNDVLSVKSQEEIKKEIQSHGWDPAVVEAALEDFFHRQTT